MPNLKPNLQVRQPNVVDPPEGNGWPTPLTDESNPIRQAVTNGSNGEVTGVDNRIQTSQSKNGGWSLCEGMGGASAPDNQGIDESQMGAGLRDPLKTTQQIRGEHHKPEGK